MPHLIYRAKKFGVDVQTAIDHAVEIIDEYHAQGFDLTFGDIVSDARMAELIDWKAIEDRTRGLKGSPRRRLVARRQL